jgi:hypothetical protein
MYNIRFWCFSTTTVVVGNKKVLQNLCVCVCVWCVCVCVCVWCVCGVCMCVCVCVVCVCVCVWGVCVCVCVCMCVCVCVCVQGKAIPFQAWTGSKVSRRLRLPDFKTIGT